MAEYIERKAIRDALYDADAITMSGVKILNQFPVADVAQVRHGRWILDEKRYVIYCSECSAPVSYYPNIKDVREENHYCPNCGAKMDLEG